MSSPSQNPKPDLDESINVTQAHGRVERETAAAAREKRLADNGHEPVSLWMIAACGFVLLIAGGVLGDAGTLFSYGSTFKEGYVRGKAPGGADEGPKPKTALAAYSGKGAKIYSLCSGCHGSTGKGGSTPYVLFFSLLSFLIYSLLTRRRYTMWVVSAVAKDAEVRGEFELGDNR